MQQPSDKHASPQQHAKPAFCDLPHFTCCIAVYDSSRGQREGREYEKVLAFYPNSTPEQAQLSIIGLAQALHSFCCTFSLEDGSQVQDPFVIMEAQQNTWCLYESEPNIWLLMVVSKAWIGSSCTHTALRAYLSNVHSMLVLLHGPLQTALLQQQVEDVCGQLQPLLDESGRLLLAQGPRLRLASSPAPLTREAANLCNPLGLHCGVPLLSAPMMAFLGVQSLSWQLMNLKVAAQTAQPQQAHGNSSTGAVDSLQPVVGVHVSWHGMPIWSTLSSQDAAALHALSRRALLPAAGIGKKKASPLKAALVAAAVTASSTTAMIGGSAPAATDVSQPSHNTLLSAGCWHVLHVASSSVNNIVSETAVAGTGGAPAASNVNSSTPASQQPPTAPAAAGKTRYHTDTNVSTGAGTAAAAPHTLVTAPRGWLCPADRNSQQAAPPAATDSIAPPVRSRLQEPQHVTAARVWLSSVPGRCQLLVFFWGALLVCIVLQDGVTVDEAVVAALLQVLQQHCPQLVSQLSDGLPPSSTLWHEQGYRYSHEDLAAQCTRATPIKKVTTLSEATLQLAAHTRNKLSCWEHTNGSMASRPGGSCATPAEKQLQGLPGDLDMACKSSSDAWVVVRQAGSRRMTVAVDQMPAPGLVGASQHVQKLCDALYPGYFIGFQ